MRLHDCRFLTHRNLLHAIDQILDRQWNTALENLCFSRSSEYIYHFARYVRDAKSVFERQPQIVNAD